jgi:diaminopimelate epimerase
MGMASFETINIPVTSDSFTLDQELFGFNITLVNTGAPHAVIFVDNIDEISLPSKAFEIRNSSIFPLGINVTFAQKTKTGFKQKTFEKGVEGFTLACGTGAVAIASVLHHFKNLQYDVPIQIKQHGGENLTVLIQKNGEAILKGPAIKQFSGELHV